MPKLLIPMFISNIFILIGKAIQKTEIDFLYILNFNWWVVWLLVRYLIFWIVYRFLNTKVFYKDIIICILVVAFSITVYAFRNHIAQTTWCSEVFGFIWGILLSNVREKFQKFVNTNWIKISTILCIIAGTFGLSYLKFKPVVFFGDYLLKIVLGLAILLFILAVNSRVKLGNKVNIFLGNISYEVFLIHGMCFNLVAYFIPNVNSGLSICIVIAFTVVTSFIIHKISNFVKKLLFALTEKQI